MDINTNYSDERIVLDASIFKNINEDFATAKVIVSKTAPYFSDNNTEIIFQLETEISDLRQKIRAEQADKVKLNEELNASKVKLNEDINAAKVKHGKLTMKVKQLSKELQARKSASPASASSGLGDDSLDKAIQVHILLCC